MNLRFGYNSCVLCSYNVLPGTYVLEVSNPAFIFETVRYLSVLDSALYAGPYVGLKSHSCLHAISQLRLEVSQDDGRIRAFPMNRRERLPYPLQLRPAAEAQYYQVRLHNHSIGDGVATMICICLLRVRDWMTID